MKGASVWPLCCVVVLAFGPYVDGTTPEETAAPATEVPPPDGLTCNYSSVLNSTVCENCSTFKTDPQAPTWYERSCELHLTEKESFCITQLFSSQLSSHEGDSSIAHEVEHNNAPYSIIVIFGAFGVGAIVRFLFKDTSIPYTVVLFLIGMSWGGLGAGMGDGLKDYTELGDMNPHLIFHVFLPVLIFESAFAMQISIFRKVFWQCLCLAGPGLCIASFLTAAAAKGSFYFIVDYGWSWEACLLLGTVLSATDPVAVVALLKELGASPTISTLIEGESLFNDGTAIVIFNVLKSAVVMSSTCKVMEAPCCAEYATWTANHDTHDDSLFDMDACLLDRHPVNCSIPDSASEITLQFFKTALGGPLVGMVVGAIAVLSIQRVFNDALIEVTITMVSAYVTFFLAEGILEVSGVLGVVACGLMFSFHHHSISPEVEHTMHHFWEIIVYLTNTMIFMLAGMIVSLKAFETFSIKDLFFLLILYVAINLARVIVLLMFIPLFNCLFEYKISFGEAVLIAWGGLRGAVGLALALVVQADEGVVSQTVRQKFIFHVAGIVILTLCVNGVTTRRVVQFFKLNQIPKRSKIMMHDRWKALLYENREAIQDLRRDALFYDTNWKILHQLTDLGDKSLPSDKHIDPYNKKGAVLTRTDADVREESKYVYLNSVQGSVHRFYREGTLEAGCARKLLRIVDKLRDQPLDAVQENPESWMQEDMLHKFFELRWISDPSDVVGGLSQWYLLRTWVKAFHITLGFRASHDALAERAALLLPASETGRVLQHCKRVAHRATEDAEKAILQRPDISCMIKTKHASRYVLNHMDNMLAKFESEGRLDAEDRTALAHEVSLRMKNLRNFPPTLAPCTPEEALVATRWFQQAPRAAQDDLMGALRLGSISEVELARSQRVEKGSTKNLSGVYLVVAGVVQIRVGLNAFSFSSGYTLGLQQLLSPDGEVNGRRFSDVWTETKCRLLYIPAHHLTKLVERYEALSHALWYECGRYSTEILMLMEQQTRTDRDSQRAIANLCAKGTTELVLDPEIYAPTATRKIKIPQGCTVSILRGECWEYEVERGDALLQSTSLAEEPLGLEEPELEKVNSLRFPCLISSTYKFATFTANAIIFVVPLEQRIGDQARRHWGRLRAKAKAIRLWVGLRGEFYARDALAVALGREIRSHTPNSRTSRPPSLARGSLSFQALPPLQPHRLLSDPSSGSMDRDNLLDKLLLETGSPTLPVSNPEKDAARDLEALKAENRLLQSTLKKSAPPSLLSRGLGIKRGAVDLADPFSMSGSPLGRGSYGGGVMSFPQSPVQSTHGTATATGSGSHMEGISSEIRQLDTLRKDGLITESEFTMAKRKLLGLGGGGGGGGGGSSTETASPQSSPLGSPSRASRADAAPTTSLLHPSAPTIEELKAKYLGDPSFL